MPAFVFGQSFHLAGENPYVDPGLDPTGKFNYSPTSGLETNRSDYVTGLYLSPFTGLSLITQARFDEKDWTPAPQRHDPAGPPMARCPASVAYTFTHFDPATGLIDKQQDIMTSLGLKLTNHWSVPGSLRYDIDAKQRIQDVLQLKYADECFVLTASYIETFVENDALGSEARSHGDAALRAQAYRRVQLQDRPAEPLVWRPEPGTEAVSAH